MDVHLIELPVTFNGGTGTTRTVSRDEVWFVTRDALGIGQRIDGTLRFPPDPDGVATVLRFAACVSQVTLSLACDGPLGVRARFERVEFGAIVVGRQDGSAASQPRKVVPRGVVQERTAAEVVIAGLQLGFGREPNLTGDDGDRR